MDTVLTKPNHSLLDQSLMARDLFLPTLPIAAQFRDHAFPTNGDGFGIAWNGRGDGPAQYRQESPAWDSANLRVLAGQLESDCFLSHVRAAPGGTISKQNSHPFVHGGWMFQHNGEINGFEKVKRDLTMDVDPDLYPYIQGSTDSEVCFFLALTYGLDTDPVAAIEKMIARVERARAERGVSEPFRGTFCASDGTRLIAARWMSPVETKMVPPSLFHSFGPITLDVDEALCGAPEGGEVLPSDAQLVVSEPLELHWSRRTWHEIPNATIGVFTKGAEPVFSAIPTS